MRVVQLFVYPVKSMQGMPLTTSVVGERGLFGDRSHAVRDVASGVVLTGRRDPPMLYASGAMTTTGQASVVLPDGRTTTDPATLSAWIGRPVELTTAVDHPSTYEINEDFEDDDSAVHSWQGPEGSFHDSGQLQVSIIATGDLRNWDVRRFRPNVVVDADSIEHLVGQRIRLGTAEVEIIKPIERCVMVTRPQPGGIERNLDVLRTIHAERANHFGIGGLITSTGRVSIGDLVEPV